MSQRITKKMPAPDGGVRPGQEANAKMPIGSRYHDIQLETNMPLAQMKEIRVIVNQNTIHRYSAIERDQINQHYQMPAFEIVNGRGVLNIPFDRKRMKSREMEEMTAINTDSPNERGEAIRSLYLEIEISDDETITGYQASPVLDIFATVSSAQPGGQKVLVHCTHHTRSAAGAGELQISDLPFNKRTARALSAVHMWPRDVSTGAAVAINKSTVERGLYKVLERNDQLNRYMLRVGQRNPQDGLVTLDFTEDQYAANALDLQGYQDFRYLLQMAGAAQITIVSEYLGSLAD